jgi:DNA topoisomerase-2
MIIDGKLVVSKKAKKILVAELKQKGFKAFPKIADASKEGETEPVLENDDDDDTETEANAYDYLLGVSVSMLQSAVLLICHRWLFGP